MARPTLTPTEARQGSPRRLNFRVLTTSLVMAILAAVVLYAIFYSGHTQISTPQPTAVPAAPAEPAPAPAPAPSTTP